MSICPNNLEPPQYVSTWYYDKEYQDFLKKSQESQKIKLLRELFHLEDISYSSQTPAKKMTLFTQFIRHVLSLKSQFTRTNNTQSPKPSQKSSKLSVSYTPDL